MPRDGAPHLALVAAAGLALLVPATANAATITVDTNEGAATVNDNCALPEAIEASNTDARVDDCHRGDGADRIAFNIAGPAVIQPAEQLPDVAQKVTIDGTTEPDFAGVPVVNIDQGATSATGLETTADEVVIKGLAITDFSFEGLRIGGDRNRIVGNLVGVDAAGADHGNGTGVSLEGNRNTVGGGSDAARNVVSGNNGNGVSSGGNANRIRGNYIGADLFGDDPLPNQFSGVSVSGADVEVVGNLISGNGNEGVLIDAVAVETIVRSNLIGTNSAGGGALGNDDGITVRGKRATIGGPRAKHRNVISGNDFDGIELQSTFLVGRNVVLGNYIGTDATGVTEIANGSDGISILVSNRNVIGGDEPGEANVISGNGGNGVLIGGGATDTDSNVVAGNIIGRGADGLVEIPNAGSGVRITARGVDNLIGGTAAGTGNLIASNLGGGVSVGGNLTSFDDSVLRNSIFDNGEEAIDLAEDGPTANDVGSTPDTDLGPNGRQNFPVLSGANEQQGVIDGELDSTPGTSFRIEFFRSAGADDAERFVGAKTVTTDDDGHKDFTFHASKHLPAGQFVTATATVLDGDDPGDTSELSDDADISVGP